nr:helix-turn-helix domain-containing protein [Bacteroides intestinalis]
MKSTAILCHILMLLFIFPSLLPAQQNNTGVEQQLRLLQKEPTNKKALKEIGMFYLNKTDSRNAMHYGKLLHKLSYTEPKDLHYGMYSHIILGQAYIIKGDAKLAMQHLKLAEENAIKQKNDTALCSIYNGMGLYMTQIKMDCSRSLSYFFKGLEIAKKCNYDKLYSILLSNIAAIYSIKEDTTGLKYSQECYERGIEKEDNYLIRLGAGTTASQYYLKKDYEQGIYYIKIAEHALQQGNFYNQASIYSMHGMLLSALGDDTQALEYYAKALQYEPTSQASYILHTYIHYARTLIKLGRNTEVLHFLQLGEKYAQEKKVAVFQNELYETFSLFYESTGKWKQALKYRKLYQEVNDSLFNRNKEYAINDLAIKYNSKKMESDIAQSKLEQLKKQQKINILGGCIFVIILFTGTLFYLYWRLRKLYRSIIQQNKQAIKREEHLRKRVNELESATSPATFKYVGSSLSNEKEAALFNQLEILMQKECIYKDNMLTKEKVSEMLDTNRTYLSQLINSRTGKSFTQYVNEFRTREAVKRLSNPEDTIPLKALSAELGFNSMTTFYSLFQAEVGMTPTQYRNNAKNL